MRVTQTLLAFSFVIGCAQGDVADGQIGRVVRNTISFSDITANQVAITQLGSAKFSLNNPAAGSMLATEGSREVLDYLVGCAMPSNKSFTVHAGPTTYTFHGDVGLAKSWTSTGLTDKQKRWISACMFARVNNQGQLMKISMRGPHHALHVTQGEVSRFSQEEGVYYGNIFTGENPIVGWSCRGEAQAAGEPEGSALSYRDCAEPATGDLDGGEAPAGSNQCGWGYAGDCFLFQLDLPTVCEQRLTTGGGISDPDEDGDASDNPPHGSNAPNTYYKQCHAGGPIPLLEKQWKEVVTVYVEDGPPSLD